MLGFSQYLKCFAVLKIVLFYCLNQLDKTCTYTQIFKLKGTLVMTDILSLLYTQMISLL